MRTFRQESLARRVAITAFALYALLLQGFLAASAPAAAFATPGGTSCALDGSGSGTSGGDPVRHHGLCCILGCATAACGYVATPSAIVVFQKLVASPIVFAPALGLAARVPTNIISPRAVLRQTSDRARAVRFFRLLKAIQSPSGIIPWLAAGHVRLPPG